MSKLNINLQGLKRLNNYSTNTKKELPFFKEGDTFYSLIGVDQIGKKGVVNRFRNDQWERKNAIQNHYSVSFEDGTFETYQSESRMIHLSEIKK